MASGRMKIEYRDIKSLHPYENNPRINDHAVDGVANSIKAFGFKVPIIIDGNGVIVCGHTRYKAAKQLGISKVPCVVASDLTDEQVRAFRLVDNKVGEASQWDYSMLADELKSLSDFDVPMVDFGFQSLSAASEGVVDIQQPASSGGFATQDNGGTMQSSADMFRERIIIVYRKEDEQKLCDLLNVGTIDKAVYSFEELA